MSNKLFLARYGDHEHINKALNDDEHWNVRASAISHNNATHEHINKALDDKNSYIRATAKNRLDKGDYANI